MMRSSRGPLTPKHIVLVEGMWAVSYGEEELQFVFMKALHSDGVGGNSTGVCPA